MSDQKPAINAIIRTDLRAITRKCFETINPGTPFINNWHLDAMAFQLEKCLSGATRRLVINVMPRSLKSISASVALPLFALGQNPNTQIISVCYNDDLVKDFAQKRRRIIGCEWFKSAFPNLHASIDRLTDAELTLSEGGGILSTSVSGTMTGRGADIIIIDDPIKASDVNSAAELKNVNDWYRETVLSRLNDKKTGVIIIVMQRLHVDDLTGHVLKSGDWTHLCLPAIAASDRLIPIGEDNDHHWAMGEPLQLEREGHEVLSKIRESIGSYLFQSQYLQDPVPPEGNLVKREWFKRYEGDPDQIPFEHIVHSWDVAVGATNSSDFSVCTVWGVRDNQYYLLNVVRRQLEFPDLVKLVQMQAQIDGPHRILIEKAGGDLELAQYLKRNTGLPVIPIRPKGAKEARLAGVSGYIEAGRVLLPEEAPWLAGFEKEVCGFPNDSHDDQVDSMTQALQFLTRPGPPEFRIMTFGGESGGVRDRYSERMGVSLALSR